MEPQTPKDSEPSNYQDLFDEMDAIVNGAREKQFKDEFELSELILEQIAAEHAVVDTLSTLVPSKFRLAKILTDKYPTEPIATIINKLDEKYALHADEDSRVIEPLIEASRQSLFDAQEIAIAKLNPINTEGILVLQGEILDSAIYTPEEKEAIIKLLGKEIDNGGLDTTNPDDFLASKQLAAERRFQPKDKSDLSIAKKEFYKLGHSDDPLFADFVGAASVFAKLGMSDSILKAAKSDQYKALGLNEEELRQTIGDIEALISP